MARLVQKFGEDFFWQNSFPAILRQKKLRGGGGYALVVGPLKKNFFCGFPKKVDLWLNYKYADRDNLFKIIQLVFISSEFELGQAFSHYYSR